MIDHTMYDPWNSDFGASKNQPPFENFEGRDDEEKSLSWLISDIENKVESSRGKMNIWRRNFAMFKGIHYKTSETRDSDRDDTTSVRQPRMVMNFIQENVEAKVSQRARYNPGIALIPNNDEQRDRNNAKAAKMLADHRIEDVDFNSKLGWCDKLTFLMGTAYMYIGWDKDDGPLHPKYLESGKKSVKVLDKDGKIIGETDQEIHVGDVSMRYFRPDELFLQLGKRRFEDVNEFTILEFVDVNELKVDFPEVAHKIQQTRKPIFDYDSFTEKLIENYAMKCTYYHRPTKHFPAGCKIVFSEGTVLSRTEFPYKSSNEEKIRKLPIEIMTDIEVIGEILGRPFVNTIVQPQRHHNMITSAIARNHGVVSAPKWMMPKGCCSINQLDNDITVVQYTGPVAPKLVQMNPTGGELFTYQDKLENYIQKFSKIYPVSQGEVPAGITAAAALRFLDEQESQRESFALKKRNRFIRNIYKQVLERMNQYYDPSDGRMAKILGKDNEYMVKTFKDENFDFNCSVVIQNTSGLPDSKAGKIQAIVDLNQVTQNDPIFKKEEIIQMLDLGADETFKDQASTSLKAANSVLDDILDGKTNISEPQVYDDHLIHYSVFMRALQSRTFKEKTPSNIQNILIERIRTIEGLMWERANKNQLFAQKVQMLDNFPVFFSVPNFQAMQATQMMMQAEDQMKAQLATDEMSKTQETNTVETLSGQNPEEQNQQGDV